VRLLLGPIAAPPWLDEPGMDPSGARVGLLEVERFESTAELQRLLSERFADCDALIMAAAVADYRPAEPVHGGKLPRRSDGRISLELEPTPDLIGSLAPRKRPDQRTVAFALEEPEQLEPRAAQKMRRKAVDAIVANPLGTMEAAGIDALWLTARGDRQRPGPMGKDAFAAWLLQRVEGLFEGLGPT
jgi:phosphopantothenoylcysteine decarboxylase/phosphopantothenate--cysteine ligase